MRAFQNDTYKQNSIQKNDIHIMRLRICIVEIILLDYKICDF